MKTRLTAALLPLALVTPLTPADSLAPPLIEFAIGLPGKQVRLTWIATPGSRYRIEKNTTLNPSTPWTQVDLVEPSSTTGIWLDPEPTTSRAFYRVVAPDTEIFSLENPILSPNGGTLRLHGQHLPTGSSLVIHTDGSPTEIPLFQDSHHTWTANLTGTFTPGSEIFASAIRDASGKTILTLSEPIEVTSSGRASDSPPSLPPAAPHSLGSPLPQHAPGILSSESVLPHPTTSALDIESNPIFSDNEMENNPLFDPPAHHATNPLYQGNTHSGTNPLFTGNSLTSPHTHGTGLSAYLEPSPSSLPGEVSFRHVSLDLPCPAGPPLSWIATYRSKSSSSSGLGPGWDFAYNIRVEPVPSQSGPSATRVRIADGTGRSDVLFRQPDGSYRAHGILRTGRFHGSTFTLTFASSGTWTFLPLDDSPAAGKISHITDRNGVSLTCNYSPSGLLSSVNDSFGRSLLVEWADNPSRITSVTARSSSSGTNLSQITCNYSATSRLASITPPYAPGDTPPAGFTFTYSENQPLPELDGNLLTIHDGAGRLSDAFSYTSTTDRSHPAFDTWSTHDRHRSQAQDHPAFLHVEPLAQGSYIAFETDELGRVSSHVYDSLHRLTRSRVYTGFHTPGSPASSSSLPSPETRLRSSDPEYFETTFDYNSDHLCSNITRPDGSREKIVFDRDFRRNAPDLERANARLISLISPSGETRTLRCDYLPGFGSPEALRPGNPIRGISVKCGRPSTFAPDTLSRQASPPRQSQGSSFGERRGSINSLNNGMPNRLSMNVTTARLSQGSSFGERRGGINSLNNGMPNRLSMNVTTARQSQGKTFGESLAGGLTTPGGENASTDAFRKLLDRGNAGDNAGFMTRLVTAHGQIFTWNYDDHGNCTASASPIPHRGFTYTYSPSGQCLSITELDGPHSSFLHTFTYDPSSGFISSRTSDPSGVAIHTSYERDTLGRITRTIDPSASDWIFSWNPSGLCTTIASPPTPERITSSLFLDNAGLVTRQDLEHRNPDGSLHSTNPAYTTFFLRDSRSRLIRIASEERPVQPTPTSTPDSLGLSHFAAIDFTYDAAGQCTSIITPAACRHQNSNLSSTFTWDERGLLMQSTSGSSTDALTLSFDYDPVGANTRQSLDTNGTPTASWSTTYDGFHRPLIETDPLGNETHFAYTHDGTIHASLYGEILDQLGNTNNLLIATFRMRKRPEILYQAWDDSISENLSNAISPGSTPLRDLPRACFFGVDVEDDLVSVDRFQPGSPSPLEVENTVWDRSPSGRLLSIRHQDDLIFSCTRDSAGRVISRTNGAVTENLSLNTRGQPVLCGRTDHFLTTGNPEPTFTRSYAWDALGRCIHSSDGLGNTTSQTWDSLGRPIRTSPPAGPDLLYAYDGSSSTGDYSFLLTTDPGESGTPTILQSALIRCGDLVEIREDGTYPTAFTRDSLGRITRTDYPDGTYETFSYNALGQLYACRRPDGVIETTTFNLLGNPVTLSHILDSLPADLIPLPATTLTFDALGRLTRCVRGTTTLTWTHDSTGNLLSESRNGQTLTATYNHRGRTLVTRPDGRTLIESRDHLGRVTAITEQPAAGLPLPTPIVTIEYTGHRLHKNTRSNGTVTTWSYRSEKAPAPPANDLSYDTSTEVVVTHPAGHELSHILQQRDANQRLTRIDTLFSGNPQGPGRSHVLTRDSLGRLTSAITRRRERPGAPPVIENEVSYLLGKEGTRIQQIRNGITGLYSQDSTSPPGDLPMGQYTTWPGGHLSWDDAGRLTSLQRNTTTLSYHYDADGRIAEIIETKTGTPLARFSYDPLGRLLSLEEGSTTSTFAFDGTSCIWEQADPGTGSASSLSFVYAGDMLQEVTSSSGTRLFPHSHNPSLRVEHWGDPHKHLNGKHGHDPHKHLQGRHLSNRDRSWPRPASITLLTDISGNVATRADTDESGTPSILAADGMPVSSSTSIGPIRWMAPDALWIPSAQIYAENGSAYSPELGTYLTRSADHNSSRSNGCGGPTRR